MLGMLIDRVHGEDGILADIGMTVLETRTTRWNKWLEKFNFFGDLLKKAEGCTTNVFIRMLLMSSKVSFDRRKA
jgi:hypothetical protein